MQTFYNTHFYKNIQKGSHNSAKEVIPYLIRLLNPQSIFDIGCGSGEWLSVFYNEFGISDIQGVDGDYVDRSMLAIPENRFQSHDLREPLNMHRKFDLVISLEVAEHISFEYASIFIENLTVHGDAIAFSAAIPGQGGVDHVNEQFPEFWASLFKLHGFIPVDILRPQIWHNKKVEWWYRQNLLLFINENAINKHPVLRESIEKSREYTLTQIHPELFFRLSYYRRLFRGFNFFSFIFSLTVKECRRVIRQLFPATSEQ